MCFSYIIKEAGLTPASSKRKEMGSGLVYTLKITERHDYSAYLSQPGTYSLSPTGQSLVFCPVAVCFLQTSLNYEGSLLSSASHTDQIHPGVFIMHLSL